MLKVSIPFGPSAMLALAACACARAGASTPAIAHGPPLAGAVVPAPEPVVPVVDVAVVPAPEPVVVVVAEGVTVATVGPSPKDASQPFSYANQSSPAPAARPITGPKPPLAIYTTVPFVAFF